MARTPAQTSPSVPQPSADPADGAAAGRPGGDAGAARRQAHVDWVHDQLQQERTVSDHAQLLRSRGPDRIAAMKQARTAAGLPDAPSGADDPLSHYHTVERMLDERAFYPAHDKRIESPAYARVHQQMTVTDDKHCVACGVQHSTLGDPARNPFGAVQMETHHHTIEWALANAIDPAKFNQHIRPGLLHAAQRRMSEPGYAQTPAEYREFDQAYAADMSADRIHAWVDHGADNLWVLCDVHHRHKFVGIHAISFPIWGPQDVVDAGLMAQQIDAAKSSKADV